MLGNLRFIRLQIGGGDVELRPGDQHAIELGLVAVEIGFRQVPRRFKRAQLRDIVTVAQLDQLGAGRDIAAGIEIDLIDNAGHFNR